MLISDGIFHAINVTVNWNKLQRSQSFFADFESTIWYSEYTKTVEITPEGCVREMQYSDWNNSWSENGEHWRETKSQLKVCNVVLVMCVESIEELKTGYFAADKGALK
jgi:hypothetical protein